MKPKSDIEIIDTRTIRGLLRRHEKISIVSTAICVVLFLLLITWIVKTEHKTYKQEQVKPPVNQNYVNFILSFNPKLQLSDVLRIIKVSEECSTIGEFSTEFFLCVQARESSFNPFAVSDQGAIGLTGVNAHVWKDASYKIEENLHSGCRKLIQYQTLENGNLVRALLRYNAGSIVLDVRKKRSKEYTEERKQKLANYAKDIFSLTARLENNEWALKVHKD